VTPRTLRKFQLLGDTISEAHSDLALFAILRRPEAFGAWDVIVGIPWTPKKMKGLIGYVSDLLFDRLSKAEMMTMSRIVLLQPDEETVDRLVTRATPWKNGIERLDRDFLIDDMLILEGYIFINRVPSETY